MNKETESREAYVCCPSCANDYKIMTIGESEYMCPECLDSFTIKAAKEAKE